MKLALVLLSAAMMIVGLAGCATEERSLEEKLTRSSSAAAGLEDSMSAVQAQLVVFLGDSLTAGYGLSEEEAFPTLLQEQLLAQGRAVQVVNAGVSGDTTAGGLSRLDWLLAQNPDIVVVGLGANDGLQGLSLEETKENLRLIVRRCRESRSAVLLLGMKIPPSYGADYALGFETIFPALADELQVELVPFLLEGVAADPALNLADGIHPNAMGHRRLAENVLPRLEAILQEL